MLNSTDADVIVIGAGVSGLAAARSLANHGLRVRILEASSIVGGRARTLHVPGWAMPIELGAEFVHGEPSTTMALARNQGLELTEVQDIHARREGEKLVSMGDSWGRFAAALRKAENLDATWSVQEYLNTCELTAPEASLVRMMVEGFHAAPMNDVGVKGIADEAREQAEDYPQYRLSGGYERLVSRLEHQLSPARVQIVLGARVRRIDWKPGQVTLTIARGTEERIVSAARCLISVSIGVLHAEPEDGGLEFQPALAQRRDALNQLAMGQVQKVVLRLRQTPFSPSRPLPHPQADFFHDPTAEFPTLWLQTKAEQVQLTAWAGGPRASALRGLSPSELRARAIHTVARTLGSDAARIEASVIDCHTHDFDADPLMRGAYSYVRPGGSHAARDLARPVEDTLFFCGEALDLAYPATVAGALGSGQHAARQILVRSRNGAV